MDSNEELCDGVPSVVPLAAIEMHPTRLVVMEPPRIEGHMKRSSDGCVLGLSDSSCLCVCVFVCLQRRGLW